MSEFWDARYAEPGYVYGTEPNAYLVACRALLAPGGRALAVADGEGRNGVWLAGQGLDVVSVDASGLGLAKAERLAAARGVRLTTVQADLTTWAWPVAAFDVVVAIFIHFMPEHRRRMHQAMYRALAPGGVLILEAFTPEQLQYNSGGPPVAEMLYSAAMLREDFAAVDADFEELRPLGEARVVLDEGPYHRGMAAVVRGVLKRPAQRV